MPEFDTKKILAIVLGTVLGAATLVAKAVPSESSDERRLIELEKELSVALPYFLSSSDLDESLVHNYLLVQLDTLTKGLINGRIRFNVT